MVHVVHSISYYNSKRRLQFLVYIKQVIRVKQVIRCPHTRFTWASFLVSKEPSLKLLRSAKLQRTNSSPISNCQRSKSAIFFSGNINYKFIVAVTRRNMYYIYIYIYILDERNILEVEMKTI